MKLATFDTQQPAALSLGAVHPFLENRLQMTRRELLGVASALLRWYG